MGASTLDVREAPRQRLSHTVANLLLEQIREQDLTPGTRLPSERELMQRLHVGRSTVREALNGLALTGVVEIRHGQGVFVASPVPPEPAGLGLALRRAEYREITQARLIVEPALAALAAANATDQDLADIERSLVTFERSVDGPRSVRAGLRFHQRLLAAGHNAVLLGFFRRYSQTLLDRGVEFDIVTALRDDHYETHRRLFEAVASHDPRLARERMTAHIIHDTPGALEDLVP